MWRIFYWSKFFTLVFRRNKLFWLIQILIFIFITVFFGQYTLTTNDFSPPNALKLSSPIVQAGILAFLIIGSNLIYSISSKWVDDVYISLNLQKEIFVSSLLFIFLASSYFTSLYYLYYVMLLVFCGTLDVDFFIDSFKYMLLYWWVPFFTSGIIGICLSSWLKNSYKYLFITVIWLAVGPLNDLFFYDNLSLLLSWGEKEPSIPFHYLYGFSITNAILFEKLIWLLISILLLHITFLLKIKKRMTFNSIANQFVLLVLIVLSINSLLHANSNILMDKGTTSILNEINKYKSNSIFKSNIPNQNYIISSYDIELNLSNNLNAEVNFEIKNSSDEKISQITFSLYHGFQIEEVSYQSKKLKHIRTGDQVTVFFENPIIENQSLMLNISYTGRSSPLFIANNQSVYLPSSFPWIPKATIQPVFSVFEESIHRHNFNDFTFTKYKLSLEGTEKIYTNLKRTGVQKWEAETSSGVTLIKGNFTEKQYKGRTIVYPSLWGKSDRYIDTYIDTVEHYLKKVNSTFDDLNMEMPNSLIILPNTFVNDFYFEEDFWFTEDHFILGVQRVFTVNEHLLEYKSSTLVNSLVPAATWKNKVNYEELDMVFAFNAVVSNYLAEDGPSVPKEYLEFIEEKFKNSDVEKEKAIKNIEKLMNQMNSEQKRGFLNEWYELLIAENLFTFHDLNKLILKNMEEMNYVIS